MNPYVFLTGCPRSGTTLLRRMVDAHPRIAVIPEIGWIPRRYEQRDGVTPEGLVGPELRHDLVVRGRFGRYTKLPMDPDELGRMLGIGPMRYADLIALLFDRYGDARGKPIVGNKTPDYAGHVSTLHELWPHARFVHLIRDGRDVALSASSWRRAARLAERYTTWAEDPVSTAALWWESHVRLGREQGVPLGGELYREIRYEDLVRDPSGTLRSLCDFLDVAFDEAMLRFHEGRARDDGDLDAKHAWKPPTPGLRDWRTQMAPDDLERFEAVAGDLLSELGYERGAPPPPELVKRADDLRRRFEGTPRPRAWGGQST